MPVITVVAPALRSRDDERVALVALNRAVAQALGLAPTDVFSVHVPAGVAALGSEAVTPWPVVTVHGGDRGALESASAASAAQRAVSAAWACAVGEVWVQWVVRA